MRVGFIGTGTIACHVAAAMMLHGPLVEIIVTRRSERFSDDLVGRFPQVRRLDTPAEVAMASDVVVLAVRPAQLEEALQGVRFEARHTVVSFISGLLLDELQSLAPSSTVVRVVPLPTIERAEGPILAFPALPILDSLFSSLGDLIVASSEEELAAMLPLTAFMSSYFELSNGLADFLQERGLDSERSWTFVTSLLSSLGTTARMTASSGRLDLVKLHETPGGLNAHIRRELSAANWFKLPETAFFSLSELRRSDLRGSGD